MGVVFLSSIKIIFKFNIKMLIEFFLEVYLKNTVGKMAGERFKEEQSD